MGAHPLNLAFRFVLELAALVAVGVFGWSVLRDHGPASWAGGIGFPLVFATLWGVFAVPDDPSRSGNAPVPVPGAVRLMLELALFAAGAAGLVFAGHRDLGVGLGGAVLLHYALSWDRIRWLLQR